MYIDGFCHNNSHHSLKNSSSCSSKYCPFIWNESSGIVQKDYFSELFGFSFRHFTDPRRYISCAWFFWFFFVSAWFCMKHYGWKSIFPFTPQLGIWITIMIATPIAASLRYIAALMFTLPFVIIIPMLLERTKQE